MHPEQPFERKFQENRRITTTPNIPISRIKHQKVQNHQSTDSGGARPKRLITLCLLSPFSPINTLIAFIMTTFLL
jgi:hypothetical protein